MAQTALEELVEEIKHEIEDETDETEAFVTAVNVLDTKTNEQLVTAIHCKQTLWNTPTGGTPQPTVRWHMIQVLAIHFIHTLDFPSQIHES